MPYEGEHRAPIAPPPNDEDRDRWYRDWIAQRFLQPRLAEFFLFDGEQVQRDASSALRKQSLARGAPSWGGTCRASDGVLLILDNAARADAYARLIGDLLEEAVPHEVDEVATEMTSAWKAMAHMSDRVERIDISPDCEVSMLASDGTDLHRIEKSAGASQVFTQALITAITRVSGRTFPFVVDTPLARLSRDQRLGVLKTFTDRTGQVILLSTDQEVVDDKLDAIRDRIAGCYELRIAHDRGVAVTTVHELDLGSVGS